MKVNEGVLYKDGVHSAVLLVSDTIKFRGTTQETFHLCIDGADGAYLIEAYVCGSWREVDSDSLTDGDLATITFYDFYPEMRVSLIPNSDAKLFAEAYGEPSRYVG
jgi:hypothetical protein